MRVQPAVRRFAVPVLVGVFILVLAGLGIVAFQAELPGALPATGGSTPTTAACSPQPCATVRGYTVWVDSLSTSNGMVTMNVSFLNASSATHADPADFELIDATGRSSKPFYDGGACPHWPRTEFANGARRGPFPVCFKPAGVGAPLKLRWTPDVNVLCCETLIRLN